MLSSSVTQPWGPHSWVGTTQTQATSSWFFFLSRTKHMHRDHICWPGPEVHPCLKLLFTSRVSSGSPPLKNLPTPPPLRVGSSGGSSTAPLCIPPHQGCAWRAHCSVASAVLQASSSSATSTHRAPRAQESLHNQPQASQKSRGCPKEHF